MSRAVLLANFLLMVLLSLVAGALVVFPPPAPPTPEPLLPDFDQAAVNRLELTAAGQTHSLTRDPTGFWTLTWGPTPTRWPVPETRVRPALRLLGEARLLPSNNPPPFDQGAVSLAIVGTSRITLDLQGNIAAGRGPARVTTDTRPRTGLTDERLHAVFSSTGLLAWRDDRPMPGIARDPTRLSIHAVTPTGSQRVELARVQGRWGLLVGNTIERADPGVVQASIDALARLRVDRFVDNLDPAGAGLATPRVTMAVQGGRGPDAYAWRLGLGNHASPDGAMVFADLTGSRGEAPADQTFGTIHAVVALDVLSKVYANPEAYLARTALGTPSPDIRRFTLRTPEADDRPARAWRYERTIDGWQVLAPGAEAPRPTTTLEARAIAGLLEFLTTSPADRASIDRPQNATTLAVLEVEGSSGLASEAVTLARLPAPTPQGATPRGDGLGVGGTGAWRVYPMVPESLRTLLPVTP